jgi:hypothetical protein
MHACAVLGFVWCGVWQQGRGHYTSGLTCLGRRPFTHTHKQKKPHPGGRFCHPWDINFKYPDSYNGRVLEKFHGACLGLCVYVYIARRSVASYN